MKHPIFALFFALVIINNAIPHGLSKRSTEFYPCSLDGPQTLPLNVTMSPDPMVSGQDTTFIISGTAKTDTTIKASVAIYIYTNTSSVGSYEDRLCNVNKSCPMKDAAFKFPYTIKPESLPADYYIAAWIQTKIYQYCAKTHQLSSK
ncbi:9653_t:CDS:1 [Paraglomus occultum]|uniref:Phosphatidylglycerol/phosphatidylinositol transfer protein n=1 Tax=Paraglomus occultum TaxID=144539 RepID=A0A9N9G186_9GLOM|nr:9653_t:CDS:1 [Paraglomus occultum]